MDSLILRNTTNELPIPKVFFCDVDRTLLTHDHVLLPEVAQAASRFQEQEVPFILATARSPTGLEKVHAGVSASNIACCFNGAWVGFVDTRETITEMRLVRSDALKAMQIVHQMGGSPIWFDLDSCYVLESDFAIAKERTDVTGDTLVSIQTLDEAPGEPFKLLATFSERTVEQSVRDLDKKVGDWMTVAQSGPKLVELVSKGLGKEKATSFVSDLLGVDPKNTVAAGDSENDYEMLKWAGIAVTVANAGPKIKRVADILAPSCDDGGLALALDLLLTRLESE